MKSADTTTCDPMQTLSAADPEVAAIIRTENKRQHNKIRLIPSENYVSRAVLERRARQCAALLGIARQPGRLRGIGLTGRCGDGFVVSTRWSFDTW